MGIPATLSTVPAQTPYIQYVATSGQTVFPYPFEITQDSDLVAVANGTTLATDSGYTLSGVGASTGGNLTFTSGRTAGDIITLYRDIPIERLTQFAQNGGFSSTAFNAEFNNIYLLLQQLQQNLDQCLQIPNTNNPAPTVSLTPTNYAGKYLAFDSFGNPQPTTLPTLQTPAAGAILVGPTAAESSASVTVVNQTFLPGNINRYGTNTTPGTTDMSSACAAALKAYGSCYLPALYGPYYIDNITVPSTSFGTIYGDGPSSIIVQGATGNSVLKWATTGIAYTEGYIRDLQFKCTAGTNHTINTSGVGGITLQNLYFTDTPVNYSNLYLNGAASTYTHDQRLRNIQIYSNTAGHSGIRLGPLSADCEITDFVMNGNFKVDYCIYADTGAQTTSVAHSHPYNAAVNIFSGNGTLASPTSGFEFLDVDFDNTNAGGDLVVLNYFQDTLFDGCYLQAVGAATNAITLANSNGTTIESTRFDGSSGAGYCVTETGTTDYTRIGVVSSTKISNFTNPAYNLIGANSVFPGIRTRLCGSTTATIAANATEYLGANGAQSSAPATQWMAADTGGSSVIEAVITTDADPGTGQTYTIGLYGNGALLTAASGSANPLVLTGTSRTGTIKIAQGSGAFLAQFQSVYLKYVSSASAGTPNVQYAVDLVRSDTPT